MSTSPDGNAKSNLRKAEWERLFQLPDFPTERPADEAGVLLSDRIKRYCKEYKLIDPFDEKNLRPAAYALSVGRNYSVRGQRGALNDGMPLTIEPYQVAIIETYETINLPNFLIGRWNIQVKRAYQGLLWVGGAQVDPGFRGHLCCPIYNLSTDALTLNFRDTLAVIDFVTTTAYQEGECLRFDWASRTMLVFDEYPPLKSGVAEQVENFKKTIQKGDEEIKAALAKTKEETLGKLNESEGKTDKSLSSTHSRIDTFLTLIFTVVAVLFTGLGIVATTNAGERSFLNLPVWVSAAALYFALQAHSSSGKALGIDKWYARRGVALGIAVIVVLFGLTCHAWDIHVSTQNDVRQAKDQASQAVSALAKEKQDREAAIQQLRQESDAKLDNLRQQLKPPQPNPSKAK